MTNITVSPAYGKVGDTVTINGIGFLASHSVTLVFGTTSESSPATDTTGYFTTTVTVPSGTGTITISASDGTNVQTIIFSVLPEDALPEYCTVKQVADWLRVDINATTVPNKSQVQDYIIRNERTIDYKTGHSWLVNGQTYIADQSHVPIGVWDWARGMPIYLKHRFVRQFDTSQGDKVEIWDGIQWQTQAIDASTFIYIDEQKGIMYIKGYLYTVIIQNRFRITYRYGGNNEGPDVCPKDIQKACILMTAIDILSTDFKMSQIPYGGEGNVNKKDIIEKWQQQIDRTIQEHSEILTSW